MEIQNIGNYKATEDWWFILPATLVVEAIVIITVRFFPKTFGEPINEWYDEFGLVAVLSDICIVAIGIAIARYVYTVFFMQQEGWSIWYFIGLAVVIQVIHDVIFAYGIVDKIPKGHNSIIDLLKVYIAGGPKILLVDAAMVAGSIGIASVLKSYDYHYVTSVSLVAAYTLTYILYTNINMKSTV